MTTETPTDLAGVRSHGGHSQFGAPRGALGWIAGAMMARMNAGLNDAAIDVLAPQPDERVLEIGFGHGRTVAALARRARFVAGVDPAPVMVRQARLRNRAALREGRVELREAGVLSIPYPAASFQAALAVNCFQHWAEPREALAEVLRVLAPGGRLVLGLRMREPGAGRFSAPGFRPAEVDLAERWVREAGFEGTRREVRRAGRTLTCLVARRP